MRLNITVVSLSIPRPGYVRTAMVRQSVCGDSTDRLVDGGDYLIMSTPGHNRSRLIQIQYMADK